MSVMPINIQQLPIAMLKAIVSDLNIDEQLVLANVSRYFYSIVSSILYKDILFDFMFKDDNFMNEVFDEYDEALEKVMPELDTDDERIWAKVENDLYKEMVDKKSDELKQKLWSELEPIIKRHHKFIIGSRCINPSNLLVELESYNNLKRYKLTIDTQKGVDQLKSYRGDKFKLMETLELFVESDIKYDVEDLFHHLVYLKELNTVMYLFHNDLKRFSGFSSNHLTNLTISRSSPVSTELIFIIHRNFKNLVYLCISLTGISWAPDLPELPIFENLLNFSFSTFHNFDPDLVSYLNNAKFWPKLEVLDGSCYHFNGTVKFEGQWNNLISLKASNIDFTNLNQWNNFNQLQHLDLKMHPRTDAMTLQTIFTKLINLSTLILDGFISSQHFDFIPNCRLLKLNINHLTDFSQLFVNFLKSLVTIHSFRLNFSYYAFDSVDLNILLKEKHIFPNLRYVRLDDLPGPLRHWFLRSLSLPSTYYFESS